MDVGVSRQIGTGRNAKWHVCFPGSVSGALAHTNAKFGSMFIERLYRKWMSGCENPLDNMTGNRTQRTLQMDLVWSVKGFFCPKDGGLAAARRLRRVIRKLPILGDTPQPGRLSLVYINHYACNTMAPKSTEGKPPSLPIDFYLSWMSRLR